jgi:hypothetical protein
MLRGLVNPAFLEHGMERIVVVGARVNAGQDMAAGGFGDLTVSPLILQWGEKKVGPVNIDQRLVFDFGLPATSADQGQRSNRAGPLPGNGPRSAFSDLCLMVAECTGLRAEGVLAFEMGGHRFREPQHEGRPGSRSRSRQGGEDGVLGRRTSA